MIGSLFTLAGETLSAIGRMIERPAFNDEAVEQFLGGRWESTAPTRRTCSPTSRSASRYSSRH